jgi:putative addiction module component (TIGR02574 family)
MLGAIEQWKSQLGSLPQQERAELAHFLLQTLEPEDEGVEEAWAREIANRVAQIQAGETVGQPAEDVFAELREQFP